MPKLTPDLSPSEPDAALLNTLALVRRICLVAVELIALYSLCERAFPQLGVIFPPGWTHMGPGSTLCALFSSVSLQLSEPGNSRWMHRLGALLAALVAVLAFFMFFKYGTQVLRGGFPPSLSNQEPLALFFTIMAPQTSSAFGLLGLSMALLYSRARVAEHLADLAVCSLSFLVLVLLSAEAFGAMRTFGLTTRMVLSPLTLFCLVLLTQVVVLRQAGRGIFAIFLGRGMGGTIARLISPFLLVLPFLREATRAHFINSGRMPPNYTTAILVSLASTASFALLLLIAWRVNSMEIKIHHLSLRDELTDLYNLRGFHLIAEQTLRLAQRSNLPFSVLFIDLDNLKQINDTLGHSVGSATLCEIAELLKSTFRETDVLGRVGGDEFAVAGQFSQSAITSATQRLREASVRRNEKAAQPFTLNFSVGVVTSVGTPHESLTELLTKADEAMYEEKRLKKSSSK
jgi:diguanylate cyclase (GGDEF)-like protein